MADACLRCGAKIPFEGGAACRECGTPFPRQTTRAEREQAHAGAKVATVVSLFIVGGLLILGGAVALNKSKIEPPDDLRPDASVRTRAIHSKLPMLPMVMVAIGGACVVLGGGIAVGRE